MDQVDSLVRPFSKQLLYDIASFLEEHRERLRRLAGRALFEGVPDDPRTQRALGSRLERQGVDVLRIEGEGGSRTVAHDFPVQVWDRRFGLVEKPVNITLCSIAVQLTTCHGPPNTELLG